MKRQRGLVPAGFLSPSAGLVVRMFLWRIPGRAGDELCSDLQLNFPSLKSSLSN